MPFIERLLHMMTLAPDIIHWSEDGEQLMISDTEAFMNSPHKQTAELNAGNFDIFIIMLINYGFNKIVSTGNKVRSHKSRIYENMYFKRDRPDLLPKIPIQFFDRGEFILKIFLVFLCQLIFI